MEPCLFRHGKLKAQYKSKPSLAFASMEPCLFRHGKRTMPMMPSNSPLMLQWSHVFSDMVSVQEFATALIADGLQWSHVFSDMVSSPTSCERETMTEASMEPCLFRHGKTFSGTEIRKVARLLQWSHVFSDMVSGTEDEAMAMAIMEASMEPCLFRHGKFRLLQANPVHDELQWSHVFSDMVRDALAGSAVDLVVASMEPCLFRHGKRPP